MRILTRRLLQTATVVALAVPALAGASATTVAADQLFPQVSSCSPFTWFHANWRRLGDDVAYAGTRWVPQGLAYDREHHWLLTSYYDRFGEARSILAVTNRTTGAWVKTVYFPAVDVQPGGHVGGLAVGRGFLWVANTRSGHANMHRYSLSTLARAGSGAALPNGRSFTLAASSYASFHRGKLFVGSFDANRVYRYTTTAAGAIRMRTQQAYPTPSYVQGLAVTVTRFVFSRSFGRDRLSYLTVVNRSTWSRSTHAIRNMSEGITWAPARYGRSTSDVPSLYVVFESTSDEYADSTCRSHRIWRTRRTTVL